MPSMSESTPGPHYDGDEGASWRDCLRAASLEIGPTTLRWPRLGLCPECESVVRRQAENDLMGLLLDMAREIAWARAMRSLDHRDEHERWQPPHHHRALLDGEGNDTGITVAIYPERQP